MAVPPTDPASSRLLRVDDPDDKRLEPYARLRERDLRGHGDRFVAEGEVVVGMLLGARSRFEIESLLVSERRAAALQPLLERAPAGVPVMVAGQAAMDAVVGFHIHRGLLALGRRRPAEPAATLLAGLPAQSLVLGLVGVSNHDNVGGIFRNAAAFGADAVLLDETSCDPLYRKALRVSVGGALVVPFARGGTATEMIDRLEAAGFTPLALSPAGAESLDEMSSPPPRAALLLGAEGPGLPDAVLERCRSLRIAMAPGFDSLNVATASGIALHALRAPRAPA